MRVNQHWSFLGLGTGEEVVVFRVKEQGWLYTRKQKGTKSQVVGIRRVG